MWSDLSIKLLNFKSYGSWRAQGERVAFYKVLLPIVLIPSDEDIFGGLSILLAVMVIVLSM